MAITSRVVTLATTPTFIEAGVPEGKIVLIRAASAQVHIGGADVTTANGLNIETTDFVSVTLYQGDDLWAVAATGTPTVRVLVTRDQT